MSRRIAVESLSNIDVNELNRLGAFCVRWNFHSWGFGRAAIS